MTAARTESFGEGYDPSPVDRFGVWLSARQIRRWIPTFKGLRVADLGCGYNATFSRTILDEVERAVLVDVSIAPELKANPKVQAVEGGLPQALGTLASRSLDAVMIVSVLEHLTQPLETLQEILRVLEPGGTCLVNVPSWKGKTYLELAAFRLGVAPAAEMNDHKMYYDVRDLWPLLVKAGFRPQDVKCFTHKFGLNTFAVCKAPGAS
jgi:SAM-dependent methyltransferase